MAVAGTPCWYHVSPISAQSQEAEDTDDQQAKANGKHRTVRVRATNHVRVLQETLQFVGMSVAGQGNQRSRTHG